MTARPASRSKHQGQRSHQKNAEQQRRPAMTADHLRRSEEVFGRAVARVVAHELYHILGRTCSHGHSGIARHSLSGQDLVAERLHFDGRDVERLQTGGGI